MITITENAAKHINSYLTKRGKGLGVRLGVKPAAAQAWHTTLNLSMK